MLKLCVVNSAHSPFTCTLNTAVYELEASAQINVLGTSDNRSKVP